MTQPRPTARLTGTATGGDGGSTGAVDAETAVDRLAVVPAVVDTTVVVEPSERPTEAFDPLVISIEPTTPSMPASATTPIRMSMTAQLSRVAGGPPTDEIAFYASLVPPSRTGNPRSPRLVAPVLVVALLAGAGAVRAEPDRLPVGDRSLSPAALALAQERAVERLAALRRPVFCGGGRLPDVALTFDDGPSPYTLPLLQLLRHARASATFFLVGDRLADWPDLASGEARLGAVGDHTWSHPRLPSLRYDAAAWEITAGRRAIAAASGHKVLLFRPPYGLTTPRLDRLVGRSGMLDVRWSADSGDGFSGATVKSVVRSVESTVRPGSIVLLHDIHPWTLAAVRRLLPWLARRGLRLVSVPELLRLDPPTIQRLRDVDGQRCGASVSTHRR